MKPGRLVIFVCFWGTVSALAILALSGIITPGKATSAGNEARLLAPVTGFTGESLQISLDLEEKRGALHAAMVPDNGNRHAVVGSLDLPGNLENILIDQERRLAYLANSFSGVQIVDIGTRERPRLVGAIPIPGNAWDLELNGTTLFVAAAGGGLQIIDVSDPNNPARIAQLETPGTPLLKLALHGETIYASAGKKGLLVIDAADPGTPRHVATLHAADGTWGLAAKNDTLYLSTGENHLRIYDVSEPHSPTLASTTSVRGKAWEMALHGDYIYLPVRDEGLQVVDIRERDNPRLIPSDPEQTSLETIAIDSGKAYLANRKKEFFAYDLSDPENPARDISADLSFTPRGIAAAAGIAYLAGGLSGMQVVDPGRLPGGRPLKSLHLPGNLEKIIADQPYYFLATTHHGLFVARQAEGDDLPHVIATLAIPGIVQNMVRVGDYLYLACAAEGLQIVDIGNPEQPRLKEPVTHPGYLRDIAGDGGRQVYIASSDDGLLVLNTTYPQKPIFVGHLELPGLFRISHRGNRIYASSREAGLHIIDVSDPAKPVEIGRLPLPWPLQELARFHQVAVTDGAAFLAAGEAQLIHLDISDERKPRLADIVNIDGEVLSVAAHGRKLYAATRQGRLWFFELGGNRLAPRVVVDTIGNCHDILPGGERTVLANGLKGMTVLPAAQNLALQLPANKYSRTRNGRSTTIDIPPQGRPGAYNLALFEGGELTEFVGAVTIVGR